AAQMAQLRSIAKRELRNRMRSIRRVMPAASCRERSDKANARVIALPEFARARTVIAYSAMNKELDLLNVLQHALSLGKQTGLPRVDDETLALHAYELGAPLEESGFGMLEPLASSALIDPADVDLILVPALALDGAGHRIGYGRAFYDQLLPKLPRAFRVGVAYDFQVVPEIPNDPHDVPMHCIVSDARTLRI
ncbi:MAG TPA: 5-formyltetrahydrofolate cyclo-ligase, partial [Polyangiales bacterium]